MTITNQGSGTRVDEVADRIYRISTPIPEAVIGIPGGFTFNQFLVVDDAPLLFHTGPRRLFALTREAVAHVMPVEKLRWVSFSHVESDESGALNEWLAAAPNAQPLCGAMGAMVSVNDLADRAPRGMADGEELSLGTRTVKWIDAPHVPHNWECGYLYEKTTRTLFAGDLATQPGNPAPIGDHSALGPALGMEQQMRVFSHAPHTRAIFDKMIALEPSLLASMHGSSITDGAKALVTLRDGILAMG